MAGRLMLDVSFQYIDQNQPRAGTSAVPLATVPNADHDEIRTINRTANLMADYALNGRWSLAVMLPVVSRGHDHLAHPLTGDENQHWGFSGVGDATVLARWLARRGSGEARPSLSFQAGLKLPTGRTGAVNEAGDRAEVPLQPCSGSYDVSFGGTYSRSLGEARTLAGDYAMLPAFFGLYYRYNGSGTERYRIGTDLQANLGASYPLAAALDFLGQVNARVRGVDSPGDTTEDVSFTGGEFVYLSPGLRWRVADGLAAYGYVQFPIYQRVNKEQITSDRNFIFGLSYSFDTRSMP